MRLLLILTAAGALLAGGTIAAPPADLPAAVYTDPAPDAAHPARMQVLHIPSHGVAINGVAYLAAGSGPHPTVLLLHGMPGNEKNLDLAQAIRRAGWNVITFNYRGAWGSPGAFRFGQNFEDADAVLAFARDPANVAAMAIDPRRLVIIGHSMGGWISIATAAHDHGLAGLVSISAADMSRAGAAPQATREKVVADNMELLAGVTVTSMAQDLGAVGPLHPFAAAADGLVATPYLAMTSNDGLAPDTDALVAAIRAKGGTRITTVHAPTDHGWSDHRIALEAAVITWLQSLK